MISATCSSVDILNDIALPCGWLSKSDHSLGAVATQQLCKVATNVASSSSQPMVVQCSLSLQSADNTWKLYVHGKELNALTNDHLSNIPVVLGSCADLQALINVIDSLCVCPGNPDIEYIKVIKQRKGVIKAADQQEVSAYLDDYASVLYKQTSYDCTIRSSACSLLTDGERCSACATYRPTLRSLSSA